MNSGDVISRAQFDEICRIHDSQFVCRKGPFSFAFFGNGKGVYNVSYRGQMYGGSFSFSLGSYEEFLQSCDACIERCSAFTPRQMTLF